MKIIFNILSWIKEIIWQDTEIIEINDKRFTLSRKELPEFSMILNEIFKLGIDKNIISIEIKLKTNKIIFLTHSELELLKYCFKKFFDDKKDKNG